MAPVDEFECYVASQEGADQEGRAHVVVRGYVDMSTAQAFSDVVDDVMSVAEHLVLTMEDVTFIDSTGIRVIATAATRATRSGSVTIRRPSHAVVRLLDVTGLDSYVTVDRS